MLRQGRIDKVIEIKEPDTDATARLVRIYARHMLPPEEDIREVCAKMAKMVLIPAAIREIVEQSKLAAIERGDVHHITADDLDVTVENTKEHNELLKRIVGGIGTYIADALQNDKPVEDGINEAVRSVTHRQSKVA
jgi:ATP-dependent 26S proteasome regulatory subunit